MKKFIFASVCGLALTSTMLCGCNTRENFVKTTTGPVPTQKGFAQIEQVSVADLQGFKYSRVGNFSVEKTAYSTMFPPSDEALWEEYQARAIKHGAQAVLDYKVESSEVFEQDRTFTRKTATGTLIAFDEQQDQQVAPPPQPKENNAAPAPQNTPIAVKAPLAPLKQASEKIGNKAASQSPAPVQNNKTATMQTPAQTNPSPGTATKTSAKSPQSALQAIKARKRQYTVIGPVKVRKQALMSFLSVKDKEILRMLRKEAEKLGGDDVIDVEITTVKKEYDGRKFEEKSATAKAIKFK